jgi:hypothetical protein
MTRSRLRSLIASYPERRCLDVLRRHVSSRGLWFDLRSRSLGHEVAQEAGPLRSLLRRGCVTVGPLRVLRFLPRPDVDDDPTESWTLEDTDLVSLVWYDAEGDWCWAVRQGRRHVDNGLSDTRRRAVVDSRRYAAGVMAHVLDWGRWSRPPRGQWS